MFCGKLHLFSSERILTSSLVQLTLAERCLRSKLLLIVGDCMRVLTFKVVQGRSRSLTSALIESPINDCNLSFILHRFRDIHHHEGSRKHPTLFLAPSRVDFLQISLSNLPG